MELKIKDVNSYDLKFVSFNLHLLWLTMLLNAKSWNNNGWSSKTLNLLR